MPMNLAIVGYGKMGRLIEQLAPEDGFAVSCGWTSTTMPTTRASPRENFRGMDVAIEFSTPPTAVENIERLAQLGVNPSWARPGGSARWIARARLSTQRGTWAGLEPELFGWRERFSQLVAEAARLLARQPEYGAWAWEIHHATKKDAPSGTLLALVEG